MEGCRAVLWTHSCPSTYVLAYFTSTYSKKAEMNKKHHHVRHRGVSHDFQGYSPLRWLKLNNFSIP